MTESPASLKARVQERIGGNGRKGKYAYATISRIPDIILPERARNLRDYYVALREVDDIVDGDAPLPRGNHTIDEFLRRKRAFLEKGGKPKDAIDLILMRSFAQAEWACGKPAGNNLRTASLNILEGQERDSKRRTIFREQNTPMLSSKEEIDAAMRHEEGDGVMNAFLTILEDDYELKGTLLPLIRATRLHFFFLRDLSTDVMSGCVNIDRETVESMPPDDFGWFAERCKALEKKELRNGTHFPPWRKMKLLHQEAPPPIRRWMREQVERGKKGIAAHRESHAAARFRPFTRFLLHQLFERPASLYFNALQ